MLNNRTEQIAVGRVKDAILQSRILEPLIDENDKTPSWDGNILMYKSSVTKKNNMKGKIPVQVKGTAVKKFSGNTISFSFNVSDLKNFLIDGGVLFFVVQIIDVCDVKIFYNSLLPVDLNELIKKVKKNRNSITATLKVLNTSKAKMLESICNSFLHNRELQYSTYKYSRDINNFNSVSFSVFPDGTPFNDYMLNNEIYLYGYEDKNALPIPITKIEVETIYHKMEKEIFIDSIKYFDSYEVINSKKNNIISFGKNFRFDIDRGELKYKTLGNLKERLYDATFLKNVVLKNYFTIGGIKISNLKLSKDYSNTICNHLKYLNDVANLMNFFHISEELNMDDFSDGDYGNINYLIDIVLYNKKIKSKMKPGLSIVKIGNINILTFILIDKDKIISIEDYFSSIYKQYTLCYPIGEDRKEIICSFYSQLKSTDIIKSSNLDLKIVEESVKSIVLNNDNAGVVNYQILELIKAYDLNNDFTNCLETSLKLCEWLEEYDSNSYIYKINKYQIIKRLRKLNKEEKLKLMEIKRASAENIQIQCGISILLENKSDFEYYFDNLSEGEGKVFCEYPIFKLIK
ncbi:hypothetical protein KPL37_07030 [Clostridium frigoris]|uniref:DUF4365 domain-containing protein n=1 Tax=Clostridium frigoris TaxID=205327 RepID=A0ABS6BUI4_9CLOT|nr:hypothetical protein [Clostridium frigoris]MBU3159508.1 hypothetical protein [Clostridium frigoris]